LSSFREQEIRKQFPVTQPPERNSHEFYDWLRSQQRLYDAVLDHMVDAVIVTNHQGKVTFVNRAAESLFGRNLMEMSDVHILDCFRDENGGSSSWIGRRILRLESMEDERQIVLRSDGREVPVLLSLVPLTIDGALIRVIGIMRDQTEVEKQNHELVIANQKLADAIQKLEEIARTDEMTELLNRRAFLDRLNEYIALAKRHDEPLALIYIDPNHFKPVNDKYGHKQGDRVIREVAHRFRRVLYSTDVVARYGGDEFIAILPRTGSGVIAKPLEKIWHELCFSIDLMHPQTGRRLGAKITVAIGGAVRSGSRIPPADEFIELAEQAMYRSKIKRSPFEVDSKD